MMQDNNENKAFSNSYKKIFEELRNKNFETCPSASNLNDYFAKKLSRKEMRILEEHIDCGWALLF